MLCFFDFILTIKTVGSFKNDKLLIDPSNNPNNQTLEREKREEVEKSALLNKTKYFIISNKSIPMYWNHGLMTCLVEYPINNEVYLISL